MEGRSCCLSDGGKSWCLSPVLLKGVLYGALAGTIESGEPFGRAENPRSQKTGSGLEVSYMKLVCLLTNLVSMC